MNFKNIHIGQIIEKRVIESRIEISRICKFFKCTEEEIGKMYTKENLSTSILLKWSKLLEYDFFRVYSQHLILYAPPKSIFKNIKTAHHETALPNFRKNLYTKVIINFILQKIDRNEMTVPEIIQKYDIPKTTLLKWIIKKDNSN